MKDTLMKLLKVKTIVTLILTIIFAILAITGQIGADQVMTIFGIVIAFYFGTQTEKKSEGESDPEGVDRGDE